jgi:hypothetical protein
VLKLTALLAGWPGMSAWVAAHPARALLQIVAPTYRYLPCFLFIRTPPGPVDAQRPPQHPPLVMAPHGSFR